MLTSDPNRKQYGTQINIGCGVGPQIANHVGSQTMGHVFPYKQGDE